MAPEEIEILAHIKRALRWLSVDPGGNTKSAHWLGSPVTREKPRTNLRPARVQETPLVFFQNKAGQAAGRIRGRVNSDPIGANFWHYRRRVTVHDEFSVLRLAREERISDGQQIFAILAVERHARPHPGMAEKVITNSC